MLPTPDTSHVPYERVYEPSEDSFLLLDTLSSDSERTFLQHQFFSGEDDSNEDKNDIGSNSPPLVLEIGTGSGVVIAFINAHAKTIFGSCNVLTAGIDMNAHACHATIETVQKAQVDNPDTHGMYLGSSVADLTSALKLKAIDILVFNPPYVPTHEMPVQPIGFQAQALPREMPNSGCVDDESKQFRPSFEDDSYLLSLSYAGGNDGMETTNRLLPQLPNILSRRGCAYILLCAQNKPQQVKERIRHFGPAWRAEMVGSSGKTAGWEKLQVIRIWREYAT